MNDDDLRRLLRRTAAVAPEPVGLLEGAYAQARRRRGRRARVTAYAGSGLATIALIATATTVLPSGGRPGPAGPVTGAHDRTADRPSPSGPVASATASRPTGPGSFGKPVFSDDFDAVLDPDRWVVYSDGISATLSRWSPDDVAVRAGTLRLAATRSGGSPPYTTGGVGAIPAAREYGRFSLRFRMTPGFNVVGQVLLAPTAPGTPSSFLSIGSDRSSGALTDSRTGRTTTVPLPGPVDRFRTLAVEWTPRTVRWTLDGAELGGSPGGSPSGPHYLAVQVLVLSPDCGTAPAAPPCPQPLRLPQVLEVRDVTIQPYISG